MPSEVPSGDISVNKAHDSGSGDRGKMQSKGQGTGEKVGSNDDILPVGRADTREFRAEKDKKAVPDENYGIYGGREKRDT